MTKALVRVPSRLLMFLRTSSRPLWNPTTGLPDADFDSRRLVAITNF
jgi:hypothetical protein